MKKSVIFGALTALVTVALFSACSKGEPALNPKELGWWGYFDGKIDGSAAADKMTVNFKNERHNARTSSTNGHLIAKDGTELEVTDISIAYIEPTPALRGSTISLSIAGLGKGERLVAKPLTPRSYEESDWDWKSSQISLFRCYPDVADPVEYIPSESDPFSIYVADVYLAGDRPAIEGILKGTLYRKDDPKQTIKIEATFGAGFGL